LFTSRAKAGTLNGAAFTSSFFFSSVSFFSSSSALGLVTTGGGVAGLLVLDLNSEQADRITDNTITDNSCLFIVDRLIAFFELQKSFPFNRSGWFGADIVHHAVDTFYPVNDIVGHFCQEFVRQVR